MHIFDCVAAIATPLVSSGLGVVRISGEGAIEKASKIFRPAKVKSLNDLKGYSAAYGHVVDLNGDEIDDAVAVVFRSPKSYTGEDVVEISCHGGVLILNLVLKSCLSVGCRPALNGEFTKRAFLNGKLSLTQAEAVVNLINAESNLSLKAAVNTKNGLLYKKTQLICDDLIKINSHIEAYLNYPDEDVEPPRIEDVVSGVKHAILKLSELSSSFFSSEILNHGVKAVLVGRPNVGKSTLMNLISGSEKSIVTNISGTTRDVVCSDVEIEGIKFLLFDTAGFCDVSNEIEKIGIKKAKQMLDQANLVLMVVDGSKPFFDEIFYEIAGLKNVLKICVTNKSDLGKIDFDETKFRFDAFVSTSSESFDSILNLKKSMVGLVKQKLLNFNSQIVVNERQNTIILNVLNELKEILKVLKNGSNLDLIGAMMESVIEKIMELDGRKVSETVVDEIFSKFCVGK